MNRTPRSRTKTLALAVALTCAVAGAAGADTITTVDAFVPVVTITGDTGVFRTDLEIFNPDPGKNAEVCLYFTPAGEDGSNVTGRCIDPPLFPRESVTLENVLGEYYGLRETYGLLEVKSGNDVPIIVTSNTYNTAGEKPGTYGQFSPGQPYRNAIGFDETESVYGNLYVTGLRNEPSFRTNAVVINPEPNVLEAGVTLVDASGSRILGTRYYTVPPFSMIQINDVFGREFASFQPPVGRPYRLSFFVARNTGARLLCYATVTDKRTGDPYLIPGQSMLLP